jgi:glycosyltransferase involved in cell wall biosynthesis
MSPMCKASDDQPEPLVSVVICSLNGHKRISRAIQSVLGQDYRELELIIVDDGSSPSLADVIQNHQDQRLRFFRFDRNQGLHAARAFALNQARGKFVALLDDDDWWLPGKLARQLAILEQFPQVGLVCTGALDLYPDGTEMLRLPPAELIAYEQELVGECTIASSVLFRRSAYEEVGGFDPSLYRCGDWDCWIRLSKKYLIRAILTPLVVTYMRMGSLQRSLDIEQNGRDRWKVVLKNRQEIQRLGLWPEAIACQYHSMGIRYLRAHDFRRARNCLGQALIHRFKLRILVALILAVLGTSDTTRLRQISRRIRRIKGIFQGGYATFL